MTELDYSDLEAKYAVPPPKPINNVILIDNAPKVDSTKEEKLLSKIRQIFQNIEELSPEAVYMPKNTDGVSKGFMFIEFSSDEKAKLAVDLGNGTKFGSYILSMHLFADIEQCANAAEEFEPPVIPEFKPKDNLKSWLLDPKGRDQFAMVKGDEVGIYYHNRGEAPEPVSVRQSWADFFVQFSPKGTYFATVYKQGIAIWAGSDLGKVNRFQHAKVTKLEISPMENYLVTWSEEPFKTSTKDIHVKFLNKNICVWDIKSGTLLRTFPTPKQENSDGSKADNDWPFLKWSYDDSYVSRYNTGAKGAIFVYETKDMSLLGKKSIKIENLQSMAWSPRENIISYWTPEAGNIPARIMLISIPSRHVVRTKNFFGLIDV